MFSIEELSNAGRILDSTHPAALISLRRARSVTFSQRIEMLDDVNAHQSIDPTRVSSLTDCTYTKHADNLITTTERDEDGHMVTSVFFKRKKRSGEWFRSDDENVLNLLRNCRHDD